MLSFTPFLIFNTLLPFDWLGNFLDNMLVPRSQYRPEKDVDL